MPVRRTKNAKKTKLQPVMWPSLLRLLCTSPVASDGASIGTVADRVLSSRGP